MELLQEHMRTG